MNLFLKSAVLLALTSAALPLHATAAESYPNRPIRLVVPFAPGAGADFTARTIGQKLSEALGQPVVVDNRAGANGIIGTETVTKAAPDGYTLLLIDRSVPGINPSLYKKLPFDPLKDLAYISVAVTAPYVMVVNASLPIRSVEDLIREAKARPGAINYGSFGIGSLPQLDFEAFKLHTGTNLVHVPYRGAALAITAVAAGEVGVTISSLSGALAQLQDGRIRAIAVGAEKRSSSLPNVPTMAEAGGGDTLASTFFGFAAPKGTPPDIVTRLSAEIRKIVETPDVAQRLRGAGLEPLGNTPAEMTAMVQGDIVRFGRLVKDIGIQPE